MGYILITLHVISIVLQFVHCDKHKVSKVHGTRTDLMHSLTEEIDELRQTSEGQILKNGDIVSYLKHTGAREEHLGKPSTEFMMNVFENLLQGERLAEATGHTGRRTQPQIRQADTIRSFTATGKNHMYNIEIPTLPQHEINTLAEFRFHGNRILKRRPKFIVNIYFGMRQLQRAFKLSQKPKIERDSYVFDISKGLVSTLNSIHGNVTLEIHFEASDMTKEEDNDNIQKSKPILVLYSQDKQFLKSFYDDLAIKDIDNDSSRYKRAVALKPKDKKGRKRKNRWRKRKHENDICQLYNFKVDFDVIGWGPWIIHPKTFNSKVCYGRCPEPIANEFSPTNHAMLQTLMRMKRPLSAPEPCCVPTKLRPLSMLYFEYEDIVVRHHEDMVAAECGCR